MYRDFRQFLPLEAGVAIKVNVVGEPRPLLVGYLLVVLHALVGRAEVFDLPVFEAADKVVLQGVTFIFRCSVFSVPAD